MKNVVIIHGQNRKVGSNYNISWDLAKKLRSVNIKEHFVNDIKFCTGCSNCILKGEGTCPHKDRIAPIASDVENADILIINSPTYVMGMSGQLKTFFDHMAYRYMVHRPHKSMASKVAVLISTAAGAGANRVIKSLKTQMLWWGVGRTYALHFSVFATGWEGVSDKKKAEIASRIDKIALKISRLNKINRGLKGRFYFHLMKKLQPKMNNPIDIAHWKENGWIR